MLLLPRLRPLLALPWGPFGARASYALRVASTAFGCVRPRLRPFGDVRGGLTASIPLAANVAATT